MALLEYLLILAAGLVLGSFSTALIYRIPREIPWSHGSKAAYRSACTHCNALLRARDLVPVFSWLLLRGKCRACHTPIGIQYPLTELAVVLSCLGVYAVFGMTLEAGIIIAAIPFLIALLMIDLEEMILPDQLVFIVGLFGGIRLGLLAFSRPFSDVQWTLIDHIAGAFIYAAFVAGAGWLISNFLKKEALGFGDVKFFFVAGLWLGLSNLSWYCLLAGFLGVAFGLGWQALKKDKVFPFGPALIAALYILVLWNGSLLI